MSPQDGSVLRAFGNAGQVNDIDLALGRVGINPNQSQLIITSPFIARRIAGVLTGSGVIVSMTKNDWIENELAELAGLTEWGMPEVDPDRVAKAWEEGYGLSQLYMPAGLGRELMFLKMMPASGTKCYDKDIIPSAEMLPTEEGVFTCDFNRMIAPTDKDHCPFNLDHAGHFVWCKEQGGSDLASGEEFTYCGLRAVRRIGFIPYMGGWCRCRNRHESGGSRLHVVFDAVDGFDFSYGSDGYRCWDFGAFPRKFKALGA